MAIIAPLAPPAGVTVTPDGATADMVVSGIAAANRVSWRRELEIRELAGGVPLTP